jgi:hypothetical protein
MGLTIHYSLKARGSDAHARKLITTLHQAAQDLPFKELGGVVDLSGGECDFNQRHRDDPLRWMLIQAQESVEIVSKRSIQVSQRVTPTRLIGFTTWPGDGCEEANFGLCKFPAVVETTDGPLKTRLSGWRWTCFCKTEYSNNPKCGGLPNFLRCHLSVIALLDKAKALGCLEHVSDEGEFWEKRDLQALSMQVGLSDRMIAAFGGLLKDLTGDGSPGIELAVGKYPDFERLEAAGHNELPPGLEKLARLIVRVAGKEHSKEGANTSV